MDLEVEVAANRDGVTGLAHGADSLARVDTIPGLDQGRPGHMGVEVAALLPFAVDQQVVAVEERVIAGAPHSAAAYRYKRCAARGDDVEALVCATAAAGSTELADVTAGAVRTVDRKDVVVISEATVGGGDVGGGRCG
jgi:hypothetical protein